MNNVDISLIIPTMNRPESLFSTLESISKSFYKPNEIVIIDQSNNDKSQSMIENKIKDEFINIGIKVKYIFLQQPSLTKARNIGIDNCDNDIIIFMDDDVEVNNDTIYNVYKVMLNDTISMIGGIDELSSEGKSMLGYIFARKSLIKKDRGYVLNSVFGRYPNKINSIVETEWSMGYFFVVRKSLINLWNIKFDENLISYAYPEDLDFTYSYYKKSSEAGLKCILHPNISVKHLCSKEYRVPTFKSTCMYVINREYLSYKHFKSPLSRILSRWANIGELLRRIVNKENPVDFVRAQYYCNKYRNDIKNGILHYEIYDK